MASALTQKKIEAISKNRPSKKREIADGGQPGLYLVVGQRTLKWMVRFRSPQSGENVKMSIGTVGDKKPAIGLHEARMAAQKLFENVRMGIDPRLENELGLDDLTVNQAFEMFLAQHVLVKNKGGTISSVKSFINSEVTPRWGKWNIRAINRRHIVGLINDLANGVFDDSGKLTTPARPQTAVRGRAVLSKAFRWFTAKTIITDNPFHDIEVPATPVRRERVLSNDEIRWFWISAEKMGWPFGTWAQLLLLTAQRRNEVAGARWSEVQLTEIGSTWTIDGERTKNGCAQVVPLAPQTESLLRSVPQMETDEKVVDDPFVFTTNDTSPISGFSRAKKRLDAAMLEMACKEAKEPSTVEIVKWTFHDLRRTATTGMAELGVPPHIVEAVLNHKSGVVSGVAAIYNRHQYLAEKKDALCAWADRVDVLVGVNSDTKLASISQTI